LISKGRHLPDSLNPAQKKTEIIIDPYRKRGRYRHGKSPTKKERALRLSTKIKAGNDHSISNLKNKVKREI